MPFTPADIFNIAVYEADDIAGNDGDPVSAWNAQSGTISADMSQSGSARPTLKKAANGLNGQNVVLFDGSDDSLTFGDVAEADFGTGAFSIFLVIRADAADRAFFMKDDYDTGTDNGIYFYVGSNFSYFNGTGVMDIGARDGSYHLVGLTRAGTGAGGAIPYFDGTAGTPAAEARTLSNSRALILGDDSGGGHWFEGRVAALYIASSVPNSTNRNLFGGYIQDKYGLTIAGATGGGGGFQSAWTANSNIIIGG